MLRSSRAGLLLLTVLAAGGCLKACPSPVGGSCDPKEAECPTGYHCALAQVCTRSCAAASDCWVRVVDGCRPDVLPLQRLPDGGLFVETSDEGFCPETRQLVCLEGYCRLPGCLDGGCDLDVWGPSPFGGNREGGPRE